MFEVSMRETFSEFVDINEAPIRHALIAQLGAELGRDAAAQSLLYGLENWGRVSEMDNPAGYLFRVGQRWGRRKRGGRVVFGVDSIEDLWFEPGLAPAMSGLPASQRIAVILRHGSDMEYSAIARLTNSTESAVRKNVERGLSGLRKALGVDDE